MGQTTKLVVGAGTVCYINGNLVGEVTSFEWSSDVQYKEIGGIDVVQPLELAVTRTKVRGTIGMLRLKGMGGLEGRGIVTSFDTAAREKYVSILIKDRQLDRTLFQCDSAVITGQRWSVAARRMMQGSASFEGISWKNEASR